MAGNDSAPQLLTYLARAREALVWKLDGLGDYDMRRPLVPTGTNLLGLVKHCAANEIRYLGDCFGRPMPGAPRWVHAPEREDDDLWATAHETRAEIVELYRRACTHADRTVAQLPPTAVGQVPWWPADRASPTVTTVLVHLLSETTRHAGQADIVRELIDGAVGVRAGNTNLIQASAPAQHAHAQRVEAAARAASRNHGDAARPPADRPGVTVRAARDGDLDQVVANLWDVAAEGRWLGVETPFDQPARRARFAALLGSESGTVLVADDPSGALAGHITVEIAPYGVAVIGMLVTEGRRGRGVGSGLLAAARAWAGEHGAHKMALEVWPHNTPAIALYERAGFVHEGRKVRHYRRRSGELWDSVLMGVPLTT